MTISPEARAKAALGSRLMTQPHTRAAIEKAIATAIREACNEKLEEAVRAIHAETVALSPKPEATVEEFMKRSHSDGLIHAAKIVARLRSDLKDPTP